MTEKNGVCGGGTGVYSSTGGEIVQLGLSGYPQMHMHCGQRRRRMPGMNNWPVSFIDFP